MPKVKKAYENLKYWAKEHLTKENLKIHTVNATMGSAIFTSTSALMEKYVLGMENLDSLVARGAIIFSMFLGLGDLITQGGKITREFFNLESKSDKKTFYHDAFKVGGISFWATFPFYFIFGCNDLMEMGLSAGVAAVSSVVTLATSDIARGAAGLPIQYSPERFFNKISTKSKKGLVALITAGSIVSTAAAYNSDKDDKSLEPVKQKVYEIFYDSNRGKNTSYNKSLEDYLTK